MNLYIIPTSTTEHLVKKIKAKNLVIIFPDKNRIGKRYFPDGEVYIRISKVNKLRNKRVVVLHSGAPEPNKGLVELELILQVLKDNKAKVEVFFTYFPYGRQDKVFEEGETNAAENLITKLVNYYKAKKIYTIDPHFENRSWVKKYPIKSVSAVPYLIKKSRQDFNENIFFLSPDKGGERRTKISGIKKERLDAFKVKYFSPEIFLEGKIVGVVDDIIETGGTLLRFYDVAKKSGAKRVIALSTHGVLSAGVSKIKKKYSKLYLTNTVKQKEANVDVTGLILKTLF